MKNPVWFEPYGWIYKPIAVAGWLLAAIALLFAVQLLGEAWYAYRSIGAILFVCFPYLISTGALYLWIASRSCRK